MKDQRRAFKGAGVDAGSAGRLEQTQARAQREQLDLEKRFEPLLSLLGLKLPALGDFVRTVNSFLEGREEGKDRERDVIRCFESVVASRFAKILEELERINSQLAESNHQATSAMYQQAVVSDQERSYTRLINAIQLEFDQLVTLGQRSTDLVSLIRREIDQLNSLADSGARLVSEIAAKESKLNAVVREITRQIVEIDPETLNREIEGLEREWQELQNLEGRLAESRRLYQANLDSLVGNQTSAADAVASLRRQQRQVDSLVTIFNLAGDDLFLLMNRKQENLPPIPEGYEELRSALPKDFPDQPPTWFSLGERIEQLRAQVLKKLEELTRPPSPPLPVEPAEFALAIFVSICSTTAKGTKPHPASGRTLRIALNSIVKPAGFLSSWSDEEFKAAVNDAEGRGWLQSFQTSGRRRNVCWQPTATGLVEANRLWPLLPTNFRDSLKQSLGQLKEQQAAFRKNLHP